MKTLYLIVPCYNEEDVLYKAASRLLAKLECLIRDEIVSEYSRILFVNDGSKDKTWEIISLLHTKNIMFSGISLSHNQGQQNALLAGMITADKYADIVISLDADLQDDINVIDRMLEEYNKGNDIVYGTKAPIKKEKFHRKFLAESFYKFVKYIGVNMIPHHSSCRLMSRRAIEALSEYGEVNLFLPALVQLLGFNSSIVHYEQNERFAGKTKYSIKKLFSLAMEAITSFSMKPIRMINLVGILFLFIFGGITIYDIFTAFAGKFEGWLLVLASVWAVGGTFLLAVGVVGEYVGKTYLETKQRPRYFISEVLLETNKDREKDQNENTI